MFFIKILLTSICIQLSFSLLKQIETENIDDILKDEERNARCCAKHMSCCKNCSETTSFEVRALLMKCVRPEGCCEKATAYMQNNKKVTVKNEEEQCENPDTKNVPQELGSCDKKLKLTIKIKNVGMTNTKNQYIIIDHVYDPLTERKQKLLNPYVLKVKQEQILQTYGLSFDSMVNSEAKEKVVNKNDEGYTGCSTDPNQNPTCGSMRYEDEVIPYSTGFCCSCGGDQMGASSMEEKNNSSEGMGGPKKTRDVEVSYNKNNYGGNGFINRLGMRNGPITSMNADNPEMFFGQNGQRLSVPFSEKQHLIQKRGGQDCSDRFTPPNANPDTYHESAHCLEFSDLWYSVYCIQEPKLFHSLQFQIYEKCQDQEGNFKWSDLTINAPVVLGTNNRFHSNEENTLVASYVARDVSANMFAINYKVKKLLIPDASKIAYNDSFPEIKGGPEEYLVLSENQVQSNGKSCNTAGVGYEAFAKQPNRCSKPKGTCLQSQPKHLWDHDKEAESQGKKGSYFLKYYGALAENPIESTEGGQNKTLKMLYTQSYTSILDLEMKADNNVVLRANSLAIITEVYVDSSSPKKTSIIVKVFNSGLVSSLFFVGLTQCPLDLPASFSNIVSKPALIPPQHQHVFNLKIECPLPVNRFFCAVEVLNVKEELIAFRKIRLEKLDRCICIWHCLCACLLADKGLKCKPMSLQHYHAAGFQGSLPVPLHVVHYTFLDDLLSLILYIIIFLCLTLLIMGITKAIVGCFMVAVGLWGLDVVLYLPKKMNNYYESDLKHRKVIYDENGWPVHPDTKEKVKNISTPAEFSINVVFFFVYPVALLWTIIRKLCFSSYPKNHSEYDMCTCKSSTLVKKKSSSLQVSLKNQPSANSGSKGGKPDKEPKPKEEMKQEPSRHSDRNKQEPPRQGDIKIKQENRKEPKPKEEIKQEPSRHSERIKQEPPRQGNIKVKQEPEDEIEIHENPVKAEPPSESEDDYN